MTTWRYYETKTMIGAVESLTMARAIGVSFAGCPYRGTPTCHDCPLAPRIAALCDYRCTYSSGAGRNSRPVDCEHRAYCKCGHDQTARLRSWGLV
jgi:hypothetical protein